MNIVILGGGKPEKFGSHFVKKAREEGHRVINISHRDHGTGNVDDRSINYNNIESVKQTLQTIMVDMPNIDIVLFNQNGEGYPFSAEDLFAEPNVDSYMRNIQSHVIVPHLFITTLNMCLNAGSKVIFMSSTMAFEYDRNHFLAGVGYPASKSFATHLMSSLARVRTKPVTFSAICPFFLYHDSVSYSHTFEQYYKHILNHDDSFNGKIVAQLKGFDKPPVEIKIKYE